MKKVFRDKCLTWLEWPEKCFRIQLADVRYLKKLTSMPLHVVHTEENFLKALPQATHAIVWHFKKTWFQKAPRLRVLMTPGAGRELLPQDDELPPGVRRINGAFHGKLMRETVLAAMFAFARGVLGAAKIQNQELWPRVFFSDKVFRVAGTKAVILGYGKIGRAIGEKLQALDVAVVGINHANFTRLKTELRDATWLIVCLPSDTGTDNLVNEAVLRAMKKAPQRVLINVGRGNAVDERAVEKALRSKQLSAAFLDVFKEEPPLHSPLAGDVPGLYRLPHMSAFAPDYLQLFFKELHENGVLR